jgi:hypothetical protein
MTAYGDVRPRFPCQRRRWAKRLVGPSPALFEAAREGAYLLQNATLVAGPEPVIVAIKLDQPSARYSGG